MFYLTTYAGLMVLRLAQARRAYVPLLFALFVFSAFRFEVGCDWTGYLNQFYLNGVMPLVEAFTREEPLWKSIFIIQNALDLPYPWINVVSSAIFFIGIHIFALRQPNPLSFLVLIFPVLIINMPMSGIRQGAAIGVMCIAFAAFVDRRLVRFLVWTLVATGLHSSAIVFLLLAPFVRGAYSRQRIVISAALAMPGVAAILTTGASDIAASRYIDTSIDAAGAAFRVGLLTLTGVFFFTVLRRKWATDFPKDLKLAVIGSMGMVFLIGIVPISTVIGDRLGYYFVPIQTMILARVPSLNLSGDRKLLTAAPYFGLSLVLGVWVFKSRLFELCYEPYGSWLFGFPPSRFGIQY